GRATRGVRGITLAKKDEVESLEVVEENASLLIVTEHGYGKRTQFDEYRPQRRSGKGIIAIKTTDKNGRVIGVNKIIDADEIMMITANGKMVRTSVKDIRIIGRNTQGVRLINLDKGDRLVAMSRIIEDEKVDAVADNTAEESKETSNV
ncbi:DNA gyrase C-terminal beta-propeller domain-containing protein, partial [Candidatus Auribacterota bacterium]